MFENKKILITGGMGFLGSNLAIRLVELGAEVTLIDSLIPEYGGNLYNIEPVKDKLRMNISDVRDEHSMKYLIKGKDFLFNLAGQTSHLDSMNNPYTDLDINCLSQLYILEACRKYNPGIKIVFAGTRQIYGKPQYLPVDERHPVVPVDVNGINKLSGEWYHIVYNNVYGIRTVVLRLTNTYGPRMRIKDARQTFLGVWIKNLLTGQPIQIFGNGKQIRDYNYSEDVVDAFLLAAASDDADGEIFNLGADDPLTLLKTAEIMTEKDCGSFNLIAFPEDRQKIDIGDYYGDYRKIRAKLGWKPSTSFEGGIYRTIEYFKKNINFYID